MHRNLAWKSELMQYHIITEDLGLWKVRSELIFCFFPPTHITDPCKNQHRCSGDPKLSRTEAVGYVTQVRQFLPA